MTLFGAVGKWVVWCFKSRFCHSLNSTSCHDLLLPKFSLSIPPLSHPPLRGYAFLNSHEESWLSSQDHVGFPLSKVLRRGESLLLKYVLKALSRPLLIWIGLCLYPGLDKDGPHSGYCYLRWIKQEAGHICSLVHERLALNAPAVSSGAEK